MRLHASRNRYAVHTVAGNGGDQYRISLDSLPPEAQARHWAQQIKAPTLAERRAELEALNLSEQIERQVAREAGIRRRDEPTEPLPLTPAEWRERREKFESLPATLREQAHRRARALRQLGELLDAGRPKMECFAEVAAEFGESASTVRRWRQRVRNQELRDWPLFLAPDYTCQGAPEAEVHPEAWAYILREWLALSQPTLTAVYRRAEREAKRRGWGSLPSIKTIKRRIEREVDNTTIVLRREGERALERLYPAQQRDYSVLQVHDLWVSDGHRADLFVRFPDGEVRRPIVMAWLDVRTRRVLGWAIGKTENVPLVRASLRDAFTRSKALPREFLIDNGRAFASKEITGGQPNRYRFKVDEAELQGLATLLGIGVHWALPGRGQSKPIESFWRTITETARRAEFAGAYCGNNPLAKPEDFDAKKAVPLADYAAAVAEDIDAYLERGHRGDSMDGRSPVELYAELMEAAVVRTPTAEQLRLCLLAAENVYLDHADRGVRIMGNRYWSEALAKLPTRGPFTVRYDPDSAAAPVAVYDGERFIAEAQIVEKTGFIDAQAAGEHARARKTFLKAERAKAQALADMDRAAASWQAGPSATPVAPQAGTDAAPGAKVAELVPGARRAERQARASQADDYAQVGKLADGIRKRRAAEQEPMEGGRLRVAGAC